MKHKGTVKLEAERLILRKFTFDDAEAMFHNWANDSEVTKYLMWEPHNSVEASRQILTDWITAYEKPDYLKRAV